jgi:glutamine amidotransferase
MCRIFGAVSAAPASVRHELISSENPLIRQSEEHDSGWGMAAYDNLPCAAPHIERFPRAAHADPRFEQATKTQARIFNVHVRRATLGGIKLENTHPFDFGPYSFSHNGTILDLRSLRRAGMPEPHGDTDSELFFLRLLHGYDPDEPVRSMRGVVASIVAGTVFSGLNFLFSDGISLYAYRLGVFPMLWTGREGIGMVASERLSADLWHDVEQDVLLIFDPDRPNDPSMHRLIGDTLVSQARIERLEPPPEIRGAERDSIATARAEAIQQRMKARVDQLDPSDMPYLMT